MFNIEVFQKIAPFLKHPLVLIGFVIFLLFSLFKVILQKYYKIPTKELRLILKYGFIISIIIVILGCMILVGITPWLRRSDIVEKEKIIKATIPINNGPLAIINFNIAAPINFQKYLQEALIFGIMLLRSVC